MHWPYKHRFQDKLAFKGRNLEQARLWHCGRKARAIFWCSATKKNIFPLRKIMFGLFVVCFCCFSDHLLLLFYLLFIYMALFTHKMQRTVLCTLKQIRTEDLIVCEPVTEKQQRRFPQCAHTRNCGALRRGSSTSARPRRRCSRRCHRFPDSGFFCLFFAPLTAVFMRPCYCRS